MESSSLKRFLGDLAIERLCAQQKEPEALSDQIRIELLHRYGGVWADATAMCARPLDDWLQSHLTTGFFAFASPGADRMLSSWFLAASKGNYVIGEWRKSVHEYWSSRSSRDDYFWFHKLFAARYLADERFRELWDYTPKVSARHAFHFAPDDQRLHVFATSDDWVAMRSACAPVYKLTHKLKSAPPEGSLFDVLCRFGRGELDT